MMRFSIKQLLILTILSGGGANAFAEPANCTAIRQARVTVNAYRYRWVRHGTTYDVETTPVCKSTKVIGVRSGHMGGCTSTVAAECDVELDGQARRLNIDSDIYFQDNGGLKKVFSGYFHLDRNSGAITTGEAYNGEVQTKDLNLKTIGLRLQSKFDGVAMGVQLRDAVAVELEFEDSDAP